MAKDGLCDSEASLPSSMLKTLDLRLLCSLASVVVECRMILIEPPSPTVPLTPAVLPPVLPEGGLGAVSQSPPEGGITGRLLPPGEGEGGGASGGGACVGSGVVGRAVGASEGVPVGFFVGFLVGCLVGASVGGGLTQLLLHFPHFWFGSPMAVV